MKIGRGKGMQRLRLAILLLALIYFVVPNFRCSGDTSRTNFNPERKPPGYLYFLTQNPAEIYGYRIQGDHLQLLVDQSVQVSHFAISQEGGLLAYMARDSLTVMDFEDNLIKTYPLPHDPLERLTISYDGRIVAYEAAVPGGSVIIRFLVDAGAFSHFTADPSDSSRFPVLARYSTPTLAWQEREGLYFSFPNQPTVKLRDEDFVPYDFSPSGQYLATDSKVFDLLSKTALAAPIQGKSQFLDNSTVLYYDTTANQVLRSNLSGTSQEVLIGPLGSEFPFAAEPTGRYVAYSSNQPGNNILYIRNLTTQELEVEKDFEFAAHTTVAMLYWPEVPLFDDEIE